MASDHTTEITVDKDGNPIATEQETVDSLKHVGSVEELGLGGLLVNKKLITQEQLEEAVQKQADSGFAQRLGSVLIASNLITEQQLLELIAEQLGVPYIEFIADREIPEELIQKVPTRFAKKFQILPIGYISSEPESVKAQKPEGDKTDIISVVESKNDNKLQVVQVVTADPLNTTVVDDIRMLLEKARV